MKTRITGKINLVLNDPFHPECGIFKGFAKFSRFRSHIFVLSTLSNARAVVSCFVYAKYSIQTPFLGSESLLQKLGNIMVLTFDLVVKTKDESTIVNFWLFKNLLQNIIFFLMSLLSQTSFLMNVQDWLLDIEDKKINENTLRLGLESISEKINGEQSPEEIIINQISDKVKVKEE